MKQKYYQVVGHRPVCSCPSGTQNIDGACKSDTSCQWNERRYENGQHYYDSNCEQRCECLNGEFTCRPTSCEEGLKAKGKLDNKVRLKLKYFLFSRKFFGFRISALRSLTPVEMNAACCGFAKIRVKTSAAMRTPSVTSTLEIVSVKKVLRDQILEAPALK